MAKTSALELRSEGDEELVTRLKDAKQELFNLRFQVATGQLDNNRRLQTVRRDIARIYTVMRERELGITYQVIAEDEASEPEAESASTSSSASSKLSKSAKTEKATA
jgi:large subunit ribosomal protein L29